MWDEKEDRLLLETHPTEVSLVSKGARPETNILGLTMTESTPSTDPVAAAAAAAPAPVETPPAAAAPAAVPAAAAAAAAAAPAAAATTELDVTDADAVQKTLQTADKATLAIFTEMKNRVENAEKRARTAAEAESVAKKEMETLQLEVDDADGERQKQLDKTLEKVIASLEDVVPEPQKKGLHGDREKIRKAITKFKKNGHVDSSTFKSLLDIAALASSHLPGPSSYGAAVDRAEGLNKYLTTATDEIRSARNEATAANLSEFLRRSHNYSGPIEETSDPLFAAIAARGSGI